LTGCVYVHIFIYTMVKPKDKGKDRLQPAIMMDKDLWNKIKIRAIEEGRSASDLISDLATKYLKKNQKKGRK